MPTRDLHNHLLVSRAISPVDMADDTPKVSQILDTALYESAELLIATGSLADAAATFTVLMEDGDAADLSDNVAVADAYLLGTEAAASFTQADDNEVRKIGYKGSKRYIRATITPSGNASAALVSAVWVQSHARHQPTA